MLLLANHASAQDTPKLHFRAGDTVLPPNAAIYSQLRGGLAKEQFAGQYHVILQFAQLPTAQQRQSLASAGIKLLDYLPDLAYFALVPEVFVGDLTAFGIQSITQVAARYKVAPEIWEGKFPSHAVRAGGMIDIEVLWFSNYAFGDILARLTPMKVELLDEQPMFRTARLRVPQSQIANLAELPFIQWIEAIAPPNQTENLPGKTMHRSSSLEYGSRGLTGLGVRLGIWDGGQAGPHFDFTGRMTVVQTVASDQHATHVAGTVSGAGIVNPNARGMAPRISMYSYDFQGNVASEMASAISNYGIVLTQNSWGSGSPFCTSPTIGGDAYDLSERERDLLINNNPSLLHVFSSGNSGTLCGGFRNITNKADKNNLVCANLLQDGVTMNGSSSRGPVLDGRLKPEISGIGTSVLSTTPNNTYGSLTGTSMATPGVSGTTAQLYEYYKQRNGGNNPPSALMKAIVCNTSDDILNPGPDYVAGFGRINGLRAAKVLENNLFAINTLTNGQTRDISITVPAGTSEIKVMLAWNDPAGAVNANPALVNNLDLQVIDPSNAVFNPWILDPNAPANNAARGVDNIDNKEQVTISTPTAGTYTLRVSGAAISTASQQYGLTWEINPVFVEVAYPAGGELVQTGNTMRILWNGTGISANQTVEYSANGGTSWTVLSSTVPATSRSFDWAVPANEPPTGQARIRVSQGAATDISDLNFTLTGVPGNLSSSNVTCAGLTLSWDAITGATGYDVLRLNPATSEWVMLASNVPTNSASPTSPDLSNWYAVQGRNNANGWVGQRSVAIEVTTSNNLAIQPKIYTTDALSRCNGTVTLQAKGVPSNNYVRSIDTHTVYDASGDIAVPLGNDEASSALPIGFPFSFYGITSEVFYISSNGYLGFSPTGMTTATGQSLPNAENPNGLIALAWMDLNPSIGGGAIRYSTVGSAPNRRLVVSFLNVAESGDLTSRVSGRIELYEGSNEVMIFTTSKNSTNAATQGIENHDGGAASVLGSRNASEWSANTPDAYLFAPAPVNVNWSNGELASSITVDATPASYTFSFTSGGCPYTSASVSVVNPVLAVTPNSLPNGMTTVAYSQALATNGGVGPYTYSLFGGNLPTGLSLVNGVLSGLPSVANTFNFTIRSTDLQGCTVAKAYSVVVAPNATTWNGTSWSNGVPSGTINTIIAGNYPNAVPTAGDFICANLTINPGVTLSVGTGRSVTVNGPLSGSGAVVVNNGCLALRNGLSGFAGSFTYTRNGWTSQNRYNFWSSPVQNFPLTGLGGLFRYAFDESVANGQPQYSGWISPMGNMQAGRGYTAVNAGNVSFTGTPNTGTVTYPATRTAVGVNDWFGFRGFNLVGNPFSSDLDMGIGGSGFFASNGGAGPLANNNIDASAWVWDGNPANTAGTGIDAGRYLVLNQLSPTNRVAPGQGFFLRVNPGTTNTNVTFAGYMQTCGGGAFYRTEGGFERLKIEVAHHEGHRDHVLLGFGANFTTDYDNGFDGNKVGGHPAMDLAAKGTDNKDYQHLALPVPDRQFAQPLALRVGQPGLFTFTAPEVDARTAQSFFLHDRQTDEYTLMQPGRSYTAQLVPGNYTDRFRLVLASEVVGETSSAIRLYAYEKEVFVNFPAQQNGLAQIAVFNALGVEVARFANVSVSAGLRRLNLAGVATGVYVVKIVSETGQYEQRVYLGN